MTAERRAAYPDLRPDRRGIASLSSGPEHAAAFFRSKVGLFRSLPDAVLLELSRGAAERRYSRDTYICRTGDAALEMWVVKEGRLTVNQYGWKGNKLSIEIMVAGDVSGLACLACRTYPGEVLASRDTTVFVLPRDVVIRAIDRHPVLAREILYAYGQRLNYIETLLHLSREKAPKRLIAALLYLYHKFGFSIPLSRAEIGEMAGTTPETAIRVLRGLERRGYVTGGRGSVTISDLAGLKRELDA